MHLHVYRLRTGDTEALGKLSYEDLSKLEEELESGLRNIHDMKVTSLGNFYVYAKSSLME